MATLRDTSALNALNEDKYINTLYDQTKQSQNQMLQDNYAQNTGALDTAQQGAQQQTQQYLERTDVEADRSAAGYNAGTANRLSAGANQQAALTQGVTRQQNVTTLQNQQSQVDSEVERQRQLLAQQYSALIKQAQAENDMGRAQALYDAAKAEEQQLMAYRQQAAGMLAGKGDTSIYEQLLMGNGIATQPNTGESWEEVLRNENALNQIYDAMQESANQELLMDYQKASSDLEAQRQAQQRQTDENLTTAYVNALRKGKNYAEVQNAYGQGSGTAAQAQLARDSELLKTLTGLRKNQVAAEGQGGLSAYEQGAAYRDASAESKADIDAKRLAAIIGAAEEEERILAENQALAGNYFAKANNDYSILGKLLGLSQDQIDRLQGTGAYARTYTPLQPRKQENLTGLSGNNAMYGTSPYLYLSNGEKAYLY